MRYKFEFEKPDFEKGDCDMCPLAYVDWDIHCVLGYFYEDCPLEN